MEQIPWHIHHRCWTSKAHSPEVFSSYKFLGIHSEALASTHALIKDSCKDYQKLNKPIACDAKADSNY